MISSIHRLYRLKHSICFNRFQPVYTAKIYILQENFQCETHPYGSHGDQQHLPLSIKPCRQIVVNFEGLAAGYKRRFGNDAFP